MPAKVKYRYLQNPSTRRLREPVVRLSPVQIAEDRDLPLEAVYESLTYCQENWEEICKEKDLERRKLAQKGFFEERI